MDRVVTRKNGIEVRLPETEFWYTMAELVEDHMGGDPDNEIKFEDKNTMVYTVDQVRQIMRA